MLKTNRRKMDEFTGNTNADGTQGQEMNQETAIPVEAKKQYLNRRYIGEL
jgi:hypothetical protein